MSKFWHIGMEVECWKPVDATIAYSFPRPVEGSRYFISEIIDHGDEITLNFTTLFFPGNWVFSRGYRAEWFRPITKRATDISIFTQLLLSPKVPEPA